MRREAESVPFAGYATAVSTVEYIIVICTPK